MDAEELAGDRKIHPCESCPWRKGVVGMRDIPTFNPAKATRLATTCRDEGWSLTACHKTRDGKEQPCAGWVVQVGWESIGLRLAAMRGSLVPERYSGEGDDLHATFEEMLAAIGAPAPPRAGGRR